jgi:hypothetical protein
MPSAAARTAGGDLGGNHRTCRWREGEGVRPQPTAFLSPEARGIPGYVNNGSHNVHAPLDLDQRLTLVQRLRIVLHRA